MVDEDLMRALFGQIDKMQQENELPYEIKSCETDLLVSFIPTFVNMTNFLDYPIAEVQFNKAILRTYTVIVLDAFNEFKKGDFVYAVGDENLFHGKVIKIDKYRKSFLPYNTNQIIFAPKGKTVQPNKREDQSWDWNGKQDLPLNPFTFDFSDYGSIAQKAFSMFDVSKHNNDKYEPIPKPYDPTRLKNKLIIPRNINIVGQSAFSYRDDIDEVFFLNDNAILLDSVFAFCANLRYVNIPRKTVIIHDSSFYKCVSLKETLIPESVMAIEPSAFEDCISLKTASIMIGSKLEIIGRSAFENCGIETLDLSFCNNLKIIKTFAFRNCKKLKRVIVPSTVKICEFAFLGCPHVEVFGANPSRCEEDWDVIDAIGNRPIRLKN